MNLIELFLESAERHKVFSFIGMAKNVGKTTTYNYIIEQLHSKFILGLTSIGRDGEKKDILTDQPKPKIYVTKGNLLATAEESLKRSVFDNEILRFTDITSALGRILLVKALSEGFIELSGPSVVRYLQSVCENLMEFGAELILIDGAFDRKSFASPAVANSTILATGAALSHDMDEVIRQTQFSIQKLSTSKLTDTKAHRIITQSITSYKAGIVEEDYKVIPFTVSTALNATGDIVKNLSMKTRFIFVKGIVSSDLLEQIIKNNTDCSSLSIIAEDGTKIFASSDLYSRFHKRGGTIKVLQQINLLAVTANPVSPYGVSFDQRKFLEQLRKKIDIPVFDVVSGG